MSPVKPVSNGELPEQPGGITTASQPADVDTAIIAGVIAAVIIVLLCTALLIIMYYKKKGSYRTNESPGDETSVALQVEDVSSEESKKEHFI
ncbi:small cell adhesion glycoprotein homolog isoform X2 [Latimeria chalumnae]|uniref:small cell adhesion glycoprotein homolog isoform X2 n=1 Tax=Latimeria chalumnae TaxID=7897 RepID=UPI0003C191BE|nr:PREDICTED: small cell adhesion glycoprotein homolog [Latimeria chalumnae]|eukprot:XP_005991476.1 PREDICTED: small cell adhesion glycoprotein homolog [Latimeria chalumnae]